jgi:hypothetical protein
MRWGDVLKLFRQLDGRVTCVDDLIRGFASIRRNAEWRQPGVYLYRVATPFQRVRGCSDVIYVGQTDSGKRWQWTEDSTADQKNQLFYGHVLPLFGPMTVWWADPEALNNAGLGATTREQERGVLDRYFRELLDWPPKNLPANVAASRRTLRGST